MPTLSEVRTAVASTLRTAITPELNVYHRVRPSVVAPAIIVMPAEADYLEVFGNAGTGWELDLVALVSPADEDAAQDLLDELVEPTGARSIIAAIAATPTLGRNDCHGVVRRLNNYGIRYQVGVDDFIGATLRMFVIATNT